MFYFLDLKFVLRIVSANRISKSHLFFAFEECSNKRESTASEVAAKCQLLLTDCIDIRLSVRKSIL